MTHTPAMKCRAYAVRTLLWIKREQDAFKNYKPKQDKFDRLIKLLLYAHYRINVAFINIELVN